MVGACRADEYKLPCPAAKPAQVAFDILRGKSNPVHHCIEMLALQMTGETSGVSTDIAREQFCPKRNRVFRRNRAVKDGQIDAAPDRQPLTYFWQQTGGESVVLSSAVISRPTFSAPSAPVVLTFTLTVTDSLSLASDPDQVQIDVLPVYQLLLPVIIKNG